MTWHPDETTPAAFATFRWHANRLENMAISLYVTDPSRFREINTALKEVAARLRTIQRNVQQCTSSRDCPDDWFCCGGVCEPECQIPPEV